MTPTAGLEGLLSAPIVEIEQPEVLDLDLPLEPVEYPPVRDLTERALILAGVDPADVLGYKGTDD